MCVCALVGVVVALGSDQLTTVTPTPTNHPPTHKKQDPADETHATATATGEALLREMDTQVKLALQAQIGIAATVDALLSTLLIFRGPLAEIALPPPSAVALEQALKDARRETIVLNGRAFHVRAYHHPLVKWRVTHPLSRHLT